MRFTFIADPVFFNILEILVVVSLVQLLRSLVIEFSEPVKPVFFEISIIGQHSRLVVKLSRPFHKVVFPVPVEAKLVIEVKFSLPLLLAVHFIAFIPLPFCVLIDAVNGVCDVQWKILYFWWQRRVHFLQSWRVYFELVVDCGDETVVIEGYGSGYCLGSWFCARNGDGSELARHARLYRNLPHVVRSEDQIGMHWGKLIVNILWDNASNNWSWLTHSYYWSLSIADSFNSGRNVSWALRVGIREGEIVSGVSPHSFSDN